MSARSAPPAVAIAPPIDRRRVALAGLASLALAVVLISIGRGATDIPVARIFDAPSNDYTRRLLASLTPGHLRNTRDLGADVTPALELRGLGKGRYTLTNSFTGEPLGTASAAANRIDATFERFLVIEAAPAGAAA